MTHLCGCCLNEKLKGTTYICFAEEQAKPNLAVSKEWILRSKITEDLKTLYMVVIITWYARSVVRESGNIMAFRNQLCLRRLQVGELPIELLPANAL